MKLARLLCSCNLVAVVSHTLVWRAVIDLVFGQLLRYLTACTVWEGCVCNGFWTGEVELVWEACLSVLDDLFLPGQSVVSYRVTGRS